MAKHAWKPESWRPQEITKASRTMFSALPRIIFPASALALINYPGGSRDGENPNIRHKSKDEILQELIDEGYKVSY